jgi:hypothetical protein
LLDYGWKDAANEAAGPGLGEPIETVEPVLLPDLTAALTGRDGLDGDAVPFLGWDELRLIGRADVESRIDRWFASPQPVATGDFAVQMQGAEMGATLPAGVIAVFRPDGPLVDGAVVIADIASEGAASRHVARRLEFIRDETDTVVGIRLTADVPGLGTDFEFVEPYAEGRVRAVLITFQEL